MHPSEFISNLRPSHYGVRVVGADSIIEKDQTLAEWETERLLQTLKSHCEYLYLDTLNKITDPVTLKVVENSDVIVFTGNVEVPESLDQLAMAMERRLHSRSPVKPTDSRFAGYTGIEKGRNQCSSCQGSSGLPA
jgi:hypothetical protein